ncbi:MAG: hypothetical protein WDO74_25540 [Pseudomonadota bacterium]
MPTCKLLGDRGTFRGAPQVGQFALLHDQLLTAVPKTQALRSAETTEATVTGYLEVTTRT